MSHILEVIFCVAFFVFIMCFCVAMAYRGLTMLPKEVKELKQPETPKDALSVFSFLYYIFLILVMAVIAYNIFFRVLPGLLSD
jgi:multisubunit Na+/H+ antiporter MnhB subunit